MLLISYMHANPANLAKILYRIGGIIVLLAAWLLSIRGLAFIGIPLAIWGLSLLLGRGVPGLSFPSGQRGQKSTNQTSSVKTAYLEMRLDHDTSSMDGLVLKGSFQGKMLSSMSLKAILQLCKECAEQDPQSLQLLHAYLDREHPDWRAHPHAQGQESTTSAGMGGPLSREEAYDILGLRPGASKDDIRQAHRTLMKKFHPDQGGSTYLATKINEAKDLLLQE